MLVIYGSDLSAPANKVRMVANALEMEYEYKRVNLREGEHRTPEFLQFHPAGKIPVIDDDGFILFESNAIIKYLADKKESELYPKEIRQRAIVDQWIDFGSFHIGQALNRVIFNRVFAPRLKREVDERSLADGLEFLNRFLPVVDNHFERHPFLAGGKMTLADINLLATIDPVEISQVDLSPYAYLSRWRNGLKEKAFYQQCHKEYGEMLKQATK